MNQILTIPEAAKAIGISVSSLRQMCREKKIKHMRVGPTGGLYRFRPEWIEEYLNGTVVTVVEEEPKDEPAAPSVVPTARLPKPTTRRTESTNNQAHRTVDEVQARLREIAKEQKRSRQ